MSPFSTPVSAVWTWHRSFLSFCSGPSPPFPINKPRKANNNMRAFWKNQGNRSAFYKHSSERHEGLIREKKEENNLFTLPVDCWNTHTHTAHTSHSVHMDAQSYGNNQSFSQVFNWFNWTQIKVHASSITLLWNLHFCIISKLSFYWAT